MLHVKSQFDVFIQGHAYVNRDTWYESIIGGLRDAWRERPRLLVTHCRALNSSHSRIKIVELRLARIIHR